MFEKVFYVFIGVILKRGKKVALFYEKNSKKLKGNCKYLDTNMYKSKKN